MNIKKPIHSLPPESSQEIAAPSAIAYDFDASELLQEYLSKRNIKGEMSDRQQPGSSDSKTTIIKSISLKTSNIPGIE